MAEGDTMILLHMTPLGFVVEREGLVEKIYFSKDFSKNAMIYRNIIAGKISDDTKKMFESLFDKDKIYTTTSPVLYDYLRALGYKVKLMEREGNLFELLVKSGFAKDASDAWNKIRVVMEEVTKLKLKEDFANKDVMITHVVNAYEEVIEMINIMYERLREWYGVYFPELSEIVKKIDSYTNLVASITYREEFNYDVLAELGYSKERVNQILKAAEKSVGTPLTDQDLELIKIYAQRLKLIIELRDSLDKYLQDLVSDVAPNINAIIGYKIAAKLIAKAGGLQKLAALPASTVQLLGAEKALFRALRKGTKPPKHGYIFQHPYINQSPKLIRGKIARTMASKIVIAARTDAFGGDFIGDKLSKELREKVDELRKRYKKIIKKRPRRFRGR